MKSQATHTGKMGAFSVTLGLIVLLGLLLPGNSPASVSGPCSDCHTMHNSQGGAVMATGTSVGDPAYARLLVNSCLGCHTGTNTGSNTTPYVYSASATYGTDTLAGGNFRWVTTDDTMGHNVFSGEPDDVLSEAPGRGDAGADCTDSCHDNFDTAYPDGTGLAGRQGCTGCHMVDDEDGPKGYHHADDSATVIDSFPWYRFLSGHMAGDDMGVTGIEDDDWEKETAIDHNEYLGHYPEEGYNVNPYALSADGNKTMTGFCSGCHNNFHVEESSGNWIRHPSDAVIPASGEYAEYVTYSSEAPVARPSLTGWTGSSNTVTPGTDLVMCLSCHRAHGSPNADMLRWDYTGMIAGGGGSPGGCFTCHTTKDD